MRKITFLLLIGISLVSNVFTNAQTAADYVFTSSAGTYSEITGTISTATGDDGTQAAIPIGFSFNYCGTNYTTFTAGTNGYITFGTSNTWTNDIASTTYKPLMAALWDDLYDDASSDVQYLLSGTTPNMIMTIQWRNIRWNGSAGTLQNFQIQLYETTNVVKFVYGTMAAPSATSASIGINDNTGGSGHFISVTPAAVPTFSTTVANNTISASTFLTNGLTYIFTPSSCVTPSTLAATGMTQTSANLSWTSAGTLFNIQYGQTGFALGTGTIVTSPSSPYALSGLTASTGYSFYVQNDCGGGTTSNWAGPFNFTTSCGAITQPYSQNFDGVTVPALPACWSKIFVAATGTPSVTTVTTTPSTAPNCAALYNSTASGSSTHVLLISPQLSDLPTHTTQIRFKAKFAGTGSPLLHVGTMSDPAVQTTFATFQSIMTLTTAWQEFVIPFNSYGGVNQYIAFKHGYGSTLQYIYIDDVVYETIPTCPQPSALAASSITDVSASLNWTSNGTETLWNVQWGTQGFALGTGTMVNGLTAHPYALTGLTSSTNYSFYVRADCGGGDLSSWSGPYNFATSCAIYSIPYFEGFESITVANTLPACVTASPAIGGKTKTYIAAATGTNSALIARTGNNFAAVYWSPSAASGYFFSAPIQLTAGVAYEAKVYYKTDGVAWTDATLYYGTSATTVAMTNTIATVPNAAATTYTKISGYFIPATTGVYYVAFRGYNATSSPNYIAFDDFAVDLAPSCLPVTALTVANITATSADLSWTNGATETSWDIEYGAFGFIQGTGTYVNNTTKPYLLTGLTPNTNYSYYVKAQCSPTDSSAWAGPFSFWTNCIAANIPYSQNFETAIVPAMPNCTSIQNAGTGNNWVTVNNPGYGFTSKTLRYTYNSSNAANAWFYTQGLNLVGGTSYRLTFKYGSGSASYIEKLKVAYGTSAINTAMTTNLLDFPTINQITPQNALVNFTPATTGVYYFGFNAYSALGQLYLMVDDIFIELTPTCEKPTALAANNITATSADLTWTNGGTETAWDIQYGLTGFTLGTGTIVNNTTIKPYLLTGLSSATTYQYYVMAQCSGTDSSLWAGPFSFTTLIAPCTGTPVAGTVNSSANPVCPAINFTLTIAGSTIATGLTYQWQSSTDGITYSNIASATNDTLITSMAATTYYHCIVSCTASGFSDTTTVLTENVSPFQNCYCTSNATSTADEEILNVTFGTLNNSSTCSTTGGPGSIINQYSNYTAVAAPNLSKTIAIPFSVQIGTCGGTYSNGIAIWIDYNQNGLYTDAGEKVYFSPTTTSGAHTETGTITVPVSATLGLTGMRVISSESSVPTSPCGTYTWGETEDYVVNISAPPTCMQPTALNVSTILNTSVVLGWTAGGTETAWDIQYGPTGFTLGTGTFVNNVTTNPYTLTGLTATTTYQYYVHANCGPTDSSFWSGPIAFTTIATVCSGTPTAGTAQSSVAQVCSSINFTLWVTGQTVGGGVTYQWQSSADGITFANIAGATNDTITATQTATSYYQCIVTCPVSTLSDTSTVVNVTINPFSNCYCTSNATNTADEEILNVTAGTLNNSSTCATTGGTGSILNEYSDYSAITPPIFAQTSSTSFSVTVGTCGTTNYNSGLAIFIDLNHNGLFTDAGEKVYSNGTLSNITCVPQTVVSGSFTIPITAMLGITRMRIVDAESTSGDAMVPCGTYGYGETEDYLVNIVGPPSCIQPNTLTATAITGNSANLGWTAGSTETAWDLQYGVSGFTIGTGTILNNLTSTSYALTGLSSSTNYQYYVLAQCTPTDSSMWTGPFSFTTLCGIFNAPFAEHFNTTTIPNCWSMNGPQVWVFNTTWPNYGAQSLIEHTGNSGSFAGVDGSGTVSLTGINLLTPFINTTALTVPQLRFFLFNNNTDLVATNYQTITVDVFDGTTWNNGMFVWGPTQNNASWQEITVPLNTLTITGPIQIRFVVAKSAGSPFYDDIIIDDVFVEEAPTCPKPTALTATAVTMNSATLGWTIGNAETAWDIQYGITGFALGTGTIINNVTTNPYALTGLNPSSSYQFYILAQCSGTDSSMWTGPISFSTLCGPVTPTYYEPFVTFLPNCWSEGQGALVAPVTFTTTVTSNWNADGFGNIGTTGAAGINIFSTARYDWLISPEIDLGATPGVYQLDFNLALTAYASNAAPDLTGTDDKFAVVISTDGGLTWSSANTLKLWDNAGSPDVYNTIPTTGTHVIIPLTGYTGIVKFGFYGESTASNADNDLFIDNVRIRRPLDLTITYPTDGTHNECGLSASEILSICVKNVSPATVNAGQNIYAWYKVDLNTPVKDTITLTSNLLPNDSICFNFTQTHNFSVQTTYLVNYWINYSEDSNNSNDTTNTAIVNGTLSVAIQGGDTVLVDPQFLPWDLSAQLTAQTYDTYLWSNFDGSVTATTAVFPAPALGWYYLTVTGSGCSASDSVYLDNALSTTINSLNQGIRVFPNPTDGKFIVEITAKNSSNYKLELISSDGRIVSTKNYSNTNQIRIVYDETDLAEGIYYLKINGDGKQQIEKVVIY